MSYGFSMSKVKIYEDQIFFIFTLGLKLHNRDDCLNAIKADQLKNKMNRSLISSSDKAIFL